MHTPPRRRLAAAWKRVAALLALLPGAAWACGGGQGLGDLFDFVVGAVLLMNGLLVLGAVLSLAWHWARPATSLSRFVGQFLGGLHCVLGTCSGLVMLGLGSGSLLPLAQVGLGLACFHLATRAPAPPLTA